MNDHEKKLRKNSETPGAPYRNNLSGNTARSTGVKLSPKECQYYQFFEHSFDAILLTIPDGTILEANPAAGY